MKVTAATLFVLPAIELVFFVLAVTSFQETPVLSVLYLLAAAFFLCLSLHVTYHEVAHHCARWGSKVQIPLGILLSLLMGVSFHAYRMGHFNHHRYNNRLEDFTSTWVQKSGQPVARNLLIYCLTWPRAFLFLLPQAKKVLQDGDAIPRDILLCLVESGLLLLLIAGLFSYDWVVAIFYIELAYIGWALIGLHNYGQHLPVKYGEFVATSYPATWYNRLLFNNGLHYEHHMHPAEPIAKLNADPDAPMIRWPHFIVPLVSPNRFFEK